MDSRRASDRIERMVWIDAVAIPLQKTVRATYRAMGPVGRTIEDALHGEFMGHPLHPLSVHLPLGAWILAALLDPWDGSLAARTGADLAVALGVVGALGASVTGATDYAVYGDPSTRRIGGLHAILNWTAIALYALSWLGRHDGARDLARVLSYAGFATIGASGYLGGLMVYEKRIGVNHAPLPEQGSEGWIKVARLADLPEGQPFRADADDVPLVLVRRGETVDVLANACAHQGASLSEGQVVDGCLECPWHGTRFRLADGEVEQGPSVFAQPRYAAKVENGEVLVATATPLVPFDRKTPAGKASLR